MSTNSSLRHVWVLVLTVFFLQSLKYSPVLSLCCFHPQPDRQTGGGVTESPTVWKAQLLTYWSGMTTTFLINVQYSACTFPPHITSSQIRTRIRQTCRLCDLHTFNFFVAFFFFMFKSIVLGIMWKMSFFFSCKFSAMNVFPLHLIFFFCRWPTCTVCSDHSLRWDELKM